MPLSIDEVKHVAQLARLDLTDQELGQMKSELDQLLAAFETMASYELPDVEPKAHAVAVVNVMDEDVIRPSLTREEALSNAPRSRAGLFLVPNILED
jgi:aspartyl-tRNA(Asn)/glutamyl-tRNA(Gln) amidotransferase subunit C